MTDKHLRLRELRCRRTGQMYSVAQHAECPYCAAEPEVIRKSGRHEDFCDFKAGEDPVSFGFPTNTSRNTSR